VEYVLVFLIGRSIHVPVGYCQCPSLHDILALYRLSCGTRVLSLCIAICTATPGSLLINESMIERAPLIVQVSEHVVMQQNAYILFYIRHVPEKHHVHPTSMPTRHAQSPLQRQPVATPRGEGPVTSAKTQAQPHAVREAVPPAAASCPSRLSDSVPRPLQGGSDVEATPSTPPQGPEQAVSPSLDSDSLEDRRASHAQVDMICISCCMDFYPGLSMSSLHGSLPG
jgi:hypothetical protein